MNILIAEEMHPALMMGLKEEGISFSYQPLISELELMNVIHGFEGLVVRSKFFVGKNILDKGTQLKFIGRAGSGTDNLDVSLLADRNIEIINAPEGLNDSVAEHTIGLMLSLLHKLVAANEQVKNGIWNREENRGLELLNSTVGIIGYGHTGSAVARKLSGFGVKVLAYDKYKTPQQKADGSFFFDAHATSCNLETIYQQADILTLHIPLTSETKGWVNQKFFEQFKKPVIFLNTSRGAVIDTNGLLQALDNGKVTAAALDVLELEPPVKDGQGAIWYESLKSRPNVILTPHVAGWSVQSYARISEVLCKKIIRFLKN